MMKNISGTRMFSKLMYASIRLSAKHEKLLESSALSKPHLFSTNNIITNTAAIIEVVSILSTALFAKTIISKMFFELVRFASPLVTL